ncbi:LLM class flavin-dependent oxidoreductase [Streptomyces sp. NPDC053069]|uniref:LLM class flavin-dependent oxidoreductase n=1 Tax=Streptomyces sp. NPDC053069 TaxID=3365695 RepID=UPI0037D5B317
MTVRHGCEGAGAVPRRGPARIVARGGVRGSAPRRRRAGDRGDGPELRRLPRRGRGRRGAGRQPALSRAPGARGTDSARRHSVVGERPTGDRAGPFPRIADDTDSSRCTYRCHTFVNSNGPRHETGRVFLDRLPGGCHEATASGRELWDGKSVDLHGEHLRVEDARLARVPDPVPEVYFGGSSPAAGEVAARYADVYLPWGEPPAQVAEKIARIRKLAAGHGRTLRFGIRLHVITRDTSEQAWAEADRLLDGFDTATVRAVQAGLARSESEGQQRMLALHGGSRENLEIHPNLSAGIGLVRGGAGTALVGSHEQVAERIREYHALGIDEFVLSGHPHLEEAYWFGEGVLPRLAAQGLWAHPDDTVSAAFAQLPFVS